MTNNDYSDSKIIKNPWPEWTAVGDGSFARQWTFEFKSTPPASAVSAEGLGEIDLDVSVQRGAKATELAVTTTTRANVFTDEMFFTIFYRLFVRLETKFGPLQTIQGQARDQWRPFR